MRGRLVKITRETVASTRHWREITNQIPALVIQQRFQLGNALVLCDGIALQAIDIRLKALSTSVGLW